MTFKYKIKTRKKPKNKGRKEKKWCFRRYGLSKEKKDKINK